MGMGCKAPHAFNSQPRMFAHCAAPTLNVDDLCMKFMRSTVAYMFWKSVKDQATCSVLLVDTRVSHTAITHILTIRGSLAKSQAASVHIPQDHGQKKQDNILPLVTLVVV